MSSPEHPPIVWWRALLALAVTGVVLWLLVTEVGGVDRSAEAFSEARWAYLPIPFVIVTGLLALGVVKWAVVLRTMGHELSFGEGLRAFLVSAPVAAITPSRAGDFLRASVLSPRVPILQGLGSVLADRLIDIQSLAVLAGVGALLTAHHLQAALIGAGLVGAWLFLIVLVRRRERLWQGWLRERSWGPRVEQLMDAFVGLIERPRLLALQLLYSMLVWAGIMAIVYSLTFIFRAGLSLGEVVALWPLATLFGLIPLTLSGLGTRDAAFVFLLGAYGHTGLNEGSVLLATFAYAFVSSWLWAIVGLPLALRWFARGR